MKDVNNPAENSQVEHLELAPKASPQTQLESRELPKHTPGPWHADENEIDSANDEMLGCAYAFYVGDPRPENLQYTQETYGNARLMAAAPTLLTALDYVIDSLPSDEHLEIRAVVEAAIRTARGE